MKLFSKNKIALLTVLVVLAIVLFVVFRKSSGSGDVQKTVEIVPYLGDLRIAISTTGTIAPKNRLEIMPPVGGRIENVLVREGDFVRVGQVLIVMSSTERAALIDGARVSGSQTLKYWQDAYKPIQVVAQIQGTVIVRNAEPGQTVANSSVVLVISDRLIVKAQVDETDIGKVAVGQRAETNLDAHPEILVGGRVSHIYYESTTVNNVTVYHVEIIPDRVPSEFRSGMSATVDIIQSERKDVLIVPQEAVMTDDDRTHYVLVKTGAKSLPEKRSVTIGMTTSDMTEITGGIDQDDVLITHSLSFAGQAGAKKNPLVQQPVRRR
ncbi:MAG: efflux RND transporter periplasmic adaptor subunit [Leptospirales bacterium]|nr:efflux RND transporter periplasmic adaptor subunit [Leptospirales bacterium]